MRELLLYMSLPVIVVMILRNPFVGLLLYTGISVLRPEMFFWGGQQGAMMHKVFFITMFLSYLFNKEKGILDCLKTKEIVLIGCVALSVLVSVQLSEFPLNQRAYYYVIELFKLLLYGAIAMALLTTDARVFVFEKVYLALFTFLALWGIDQHFRGNERLEEMGDFDSNGLAAVFVMALPLGLNLAVHGENKRMKSAGVAASIVIVFGIVFTQSRGGFLGMAAALLVVLFRSRNKKMFLVWGTLAMLLLLPYFTDSYRSRLSTIAADTDERDYSAASRVLLWRAGLLLFQENPFAGAGLLAFPVAVRDFAYRFGDEDPELVRYTFNGTKVSHSTYVQLLSEGGLLLFVPYFWLVAGTFLGNRKLRLLLRDREDRPLLDLLNSIEAGMIGFCVSAVFINTLTMVFLPLQVVVSRVVRDRLMLHLADRSADKPVAGGTS